MSLVAISDATITTADTYLTQYCQAALAAGASVAKTLSVTIPAGTAARSYYIGAIADATATNVESDETNNTSSTAMAVYVPTPDLTVIGSAPARAPSRKGGLLPSPARCRTSARRRPG